MRIVFTIVLLFHLSNLAAQIITVRDKENANPLEYVTISCHNPQVSVITNSHGQANVADFVNAQTIEIRIIGYTSRTISWEELNSTNFNVLLIPSIFSIDQVVVSATKWKQTSLEIPIKVRSISRNQIAQNNPQTAADLLAISGDVFIQKSQQGGGSPMIRGFATNRVLIAVDGVRMNNAIFRSGNLQNVISLDPFAIEKTEILFGPGSVIYGSDAIGGVMNFYTLKPKYSSNGKPLVNGSFTTRYATANNEKTGHFDLNLGFNKIAFVTSISYNNFGDIKMGAFGPEEYLRNEFVRREGNTDFVVENPDPRVQVSTGYSQVNLMQKISFKPNAKWDFNYGFHHSFTSNFDRYDRLIAYKNGLPRSAEWYYGPQVWTMNNFEANNININNFYDRLTVHAAHQYFEESRNDRNFNGAILRERIEKVHAGSLNLDLSKSIGLSNSLFYGAEAIYNDIYSSGIDKNIINGTEVEGPSRYPKSNWSSYAIYLSYQQKVNSKINLQGGARYNQFVLNAQFDNTFFPFPFATTTISKGALTGSLGLTLNPTKQWKIVANLSTGFRSPNVDDIGKIFDSAPGSVVVPNPNLSPEYAYNAEIGITRMVSEIFEFDFLTFFTLLDNAMVKRDALFNGQDSIIYSGELSQVQSIQNAAFARVWGFQTDFELKIGNGFELSSRFNYQKGLEEIDNGTISPLRHATPWFGITRFAYSYKQLKVDLYSTYSGKVTFANLADEERGKPHIYAIDPNGNPYSPGWYSLNFRANYHLGKTISLSGCIENITNQRYRPYSSGIVAPGLNFLLSVKVNF
jgi:hemoglobin/transferrin/lactoferrin receptor protein